MKFGALFAILPLVSALSFPHVPSPGDALTFADSLLHNGNGSPSAKLSGASDITLQSVTSTEDHVVLTSAHHPDHSVRIKSTEGWCDPTVKSYSGYLDVSKGDGRDLFFYFFESRGNPETDPVIMWINGGPGCSSAIGLFMELGPCSVKDDPKGVNDTEFNPYSWNENANIFFLDEPIGVGFSEAQHHQVVGTAEEAGQDVAAFISIFFDTFKEYKGREFHMAGESYGGRYLPIFASAVVDNNRKLAAAGKEPINLKSVMIGNGITDSYATAESYYPFQCTIHGGLNQTVQSISECVAMAEAVPKCHKMAQRACIESHDYTECTMAEAYCSETLGASFLRAGVNPYDVSKPCTLKELKDSLCYSVTDKITQYLDLQEVRNLLGVSPTRPKFASCDGAVGEAFHMSLDRTGQTWLYVANLLERGIKVLNYAGTFDFICNHIGNEMWMNRMEWSGKEGFNKAEFAEFKVDGQVAGSYKTYENLTLMKILRAGHMVPYDKPKEALKMVNEWISA